MKPRILFVGRTRYQLPLPQWLERKWDALGEELDYRVLASAAGPGTRSAGRFELVPPGPSSSLDGVTFYARLPLRLARTIKAFDPHAVVAEDPRTAALAIAARALAGRSRPRVIAEVHGDWRHSTRLYGSRGRNLLSPLVDALDTYGIRKADGVRALSAYTAALVEEARGAAPTAVFPTYTDLSLFTSQPVQTLPERPTALFVGALERYKNVDGLARAWRLAAPRLPDSRLVIIGSGPLRAVVERLSADLPGRVEYLGTVPPAEVARRLDTATVLVLPSRYEGLGRVVIEAFARGRGVVGSRAGGILDLVDEGVEGLLVEPEDVEGLADALVRVLSERQLAERLGAAAHTRFADWDQSPAEFARRMKELVDAVLIRGRERG